MHKPLSHKPSLMRTGSIIIQFALLLGIGLLWMVVFTDHAYAYVDPSVMTYTIQALAGVAVALSALAGVIIRRIRRKFMTTFNIDENANKVTEGSIHQIDPDSPDAPNLFEAADKRAEAIRIDSAKTKDMRGIEKLTWKKRFLFALLMSVFFFFIVLIAPGIEVYGNNADSLVLPLQEVWWIPFVFNGILALICACALSALKGKTFLITLLVLFCVTLASYIQAFFMNQGMMPADGGFIGWGEWHFVSKSIFNGIVWAAIIAIPLFASRHHRMVWIKATSVVAACVIIMQVAGVASVFAESNEANNIDNGKPYITQEDLYTVSNKNNVIFFVVDSYDTHVLEKLIARNPKLLDSFTDFTYFPNTLGTMIPTTYALPYFLSGEKPGYDEDMAHYRGDRYKRSNLLETIDDNDYSIGIYTDTTMFDYQKDCDHALSDLTINIHPIDNPPVDVLQSFFMIDRMALYRQAPWALKQFFWYYTTDVNNKMIAERPDSDGSDQLYELDDPAIMEHIRTKGVHADDNRKKGAFRLIHLFGPHFPFNMDENGNRLKGSYNDADRQALGSLKILEEYINELKRLGVYDEATIIITADHGNWIEQEDPVHEAITPILLVKPSMPSGSPQEPCKISHMPLSHEDIPPTIIEAMGGNPEDFGSGMTVWDIDDEDRIRYFDAVTNVGGNGRRIVEYEVQGDALAVKNWKKTGREWTGA